MEPGHVGGLTVDGDVPSKITGYYADVCEVNLPVTRRAYDYHIFRAQHARMASANFLNVVHLCIGNAVPLQEALNAADTASSAVELFQHFSYEARSMKRVQADIASLGWQRCMVFIEPSNSVN